MKKGDFVQFKCDWGKQPEIRQLGLITRVAKDGSWVDVKTKYGSKRIRQPEKYLRVVPEDEAIAIFIGE